MKNDLSRAIPLLQSGQSLGKTGKVKGAVDLLDQFARAGELGEHGVGLG
jgi:hypothetical protein